MALLYLLSSTKFQWTHLVEAIQKYGETFVVIDLGDGLISAVHYLWEDHKSYQDQLLLTLFHPITAYFISFHFDYKEQHILGKNHYVNLEDGTLQLYRNNNKVQTFIWLRSETKNKVGEIVFDRMNIDIQTYCGIKSHPKVRVFAPLRYMLGM